MEAQIPEANANVFVGPLDNHVTTDILSEGDDGCKIDDLNVNIHSSEVFEKGSQEVGPTGAEHSNPTGFDNECPDADDEIAVTVQEPSNEAVLDKTYSPKCILEPTEINVESAKAEAAADHHTELGHVPSIKLSNGFVESSSNFDADGPSISAAEKHSINLSFPAETDDQPNCLSTDNCIMSKDTGGIDLNIDYSSGPKSPTSGSAAICFYQCCSECFFTLSNLLLRFINTEWKSKGRSQSTLEDVHDFVASLSANLHLSLSKLCEGEGSRGMSGNGAVCRKHCICQKLQVADHKNSWTGECDCHGEGRISDDGREVDCRFVFKDGVLGDIETGTDVCYHCKYEKLCLCFVIEWLVRSKEAFG